MIDEGIWSREPRSKALFQLVPYERVLVLSVDDTITMEQHTFNFLLYCLEHRGKRGAST